MENNKLDKIIGYFRNLKEESVVTSSTSDAAGFSGSSNSKGPTAGFDPVMGLRRRKGPQIKLQPGSRKRWMKSE